MKATRVLFLVEGRTTPSSRLRVNSHLPALRDAGFDVDVLDVPRGPLARLARWLALPAYAIIVIQKKLLRRLDLLVLARKAAHLVYDFDDAVTVGPFGAQPDPHRTARFHATIDRCAAVIAGNETLAAYAADHPRVRIIPTGIDLSAYRVKAGPEADRPKREVVIGWIGTGGNLRSLDALAPVFETLARQAIPVRLRVVCDRAPKRYAMPVDYEPWALDREAEVLEGFDIGVMPLDESAWSQGKCGFKLLQYMAAGLPAVASPVGVNRSIVQHGDNGVLAKTPEEWSVHLSRLIGDPALRSRIGRAARRTVETRFSLARCSEALIAVLHEVRDAPWRSVRLESIRDPGRIPQRSGVEGSGEIRMSQAVSKPTILHTESSLGWGGQEIRILAEADGMRRRGHRVLIAAAPDSGIFQRAGARGVEVVPLELDGWRMPLAVRRLVGLIRRERVAIVNTHSSRDSWLASAAVRFSRPRPVLIRTRHLSTPIERSLLTRLLYNRLPDAVITTGEAIRQTMMLHHGFNGDKIVSIPTGIDTEAFAKRSMNGAFRQAYAIPKDAPLVGIVAVLRSWKGHEDFLEAARQVAPVVPNARFVIVGDGPRYQNIKDHVERCGLADRVVMTGHVDDVPAVLGALDVFVLSSYGHEGVPQAVLQAMSMEVPVVATEVGSIPEVVRDGVTGLLAPARDPQALASRIITLLQHEDLRRKIAAAGRKLVESEYRFDTMLDRLSSLYRELLERRASILDPRGAKAERR